MAGAEFLSVRKRSQDVKPAQLAIAVAVIAATLIMARANWAGAQYVPIPNYTGIGAGAEFRGDLNNHLSGTTAIAPRLVSLTFGQLPVEQDGQLYWCKDCEQAALCAGGGTGALAVGAQGQWSCSTGSAGGAEAPINTLPAQTANYSANSHKITSLATDSVVGDALSNGNSTMNSLAVPTANVAMNSTKFTGLLAGGSTNDSMAYGQANAELAHNQNEIAIVSASSPQSGSGTSVALSPPSSIVNGNALLIIIQTNLGSSSASFTFPSGFTNITGAQEVGGNPADAIACKTAASENGNYAVSWTGGSADYAGLVIQLAGTSCANVDGSSAAFGSNVASQAAGTIATAHENDLVIAFGTNSNGGTPSFTRGTALWGSTSHGDGGVYFTQPYGATPALSYVNSDSPSTHNIAVGEVAFYASATITSPPILHGSSGGVVNDLAGSFNQVINVQSPFCYVAGAQGLTLPMGAIGDGNHDDTAAIQNAILCACGMPSLASEQMNTHNGHPRVLLPYTGANACYKTDQPERAFCASLDFGGDPGGSNAGGAHTTLCPNFAGPAVIAEGPQYYIPSYATSMLTGTGNSFVSNGSAMPVMLSDWLNSHEVNFTSNTALGIDMTVNLSSLASGGADGTLFQWTLVGVGANNARGISTTFTLARIGVNSSGQTACSIYTTGSGNVSGTSTDTGFTLNANHTMSLDWNGSDLYCFRDGVEVVGPLAAAGNLWTSTASGGSAFDAGEFPFVLTGNWPDQSFTYPTTEVVGKFDGINIANVALHTAAYTPATTKPVVNSNTQLIINFPSTCTAVGQANCSTDGTILGQTYTGIVGSGNVFLPLRSENYGTNTQTPYIHLHDLELCGNKNFGAPDGFFGIWDFDLELDHLTCSSANHIGFDLYSNDWNSWIHDLTIQGTGHSLGVEFGNAYNESHDQNINDNGGIVGTVSAGGSGGQYDEYFQHDGEGISVYDWIYAGTRMTAMYFSTDDGGSEPGHLANFHLDSNSGGEIIDGQFQLLGSSGLPIEEWGSSGSSPVTVIGSQFVYDGTYPSELVNHVTAGGNTDLPAGPDTFIGAQIPANSGNPIALSNPSGWVLDLGDQNGGNAQAVYHGTVGSGAQAVPAGAANLDGHTFRISDGAGTATSPTCTAGSAYAGAAGSGRCEVSWKNSVPAYVYTGVEW